jgi:UDP-4-amino-4,6-dideoxy-N-acetyl-beta-L-altrosamine N-acetyltransferase
MKICKYGITLNRLRQEDLEFVRQKRNSEKADHVIESGDEITSDMQQKWFDGINNSENFYFIIEYKGNRIGMLNNKNIDWEAGTSESSLFLWDETYSSTIVPVLASLCIIEVIFYYLNWNTSYIRIHSENIKAIENAGSLGYELTEGKEIVENQLYYLTRELFETKGIVMRQEAQAFTDAESGEGYLVLEPFDYESGIAQKIETHITESGVYLHRKGKAGSRIYFR